MKYQKVEAATHRAIDRYIQQLDHYTMEQLMEKPSEAEWSVGQVYVHVWMAAKGFFYKNAERCLKGEQTMRGQGKNWGGRVVFWFNAIPNRKYKMPGEVAVQPLQPESKEKLVLRLSEIKVLTTEFLQQLSEADPDVKVRHPFMGYLNAAEWMQLCAMHFNHHHHQIKRIHHHFGWPVKD